MQCYCFYRELTFFTVHFKRLLYLYAKRVASKIVFYMILYLKLFFFICKFVFYIVTDWFNCKCFSEIFSRLCNLLFVLAFTFTVNIFHATALGVILVFIFPHSNRIWRDVEYLSVFSPIAGKYRLE